MVVYTFLTLVRNVRKSYIYYIPQVLFTRGGSRQVFLTHLVLASLVHDHGITSGVELILEPWPLTDFSFPIWVRVHLPTYILTSMTLRDWLNFTRAHGTITHAAFLFNSEPTPFINWWFESSSPTPFHIHIHIHFHSYLLTNFRISPGPCSGFEPTHFAYFLPFISC